MDNKQKNYAIVTGSSIIVMTIVAILIMGEIFAPIFKMNLTDLSKHLPKLKNALIIGVLGWVIIFFCDLLVSWGLYKFYSKKDKFNAGIMGGLRFIYTIILLVAIIYLSNIFLVYNEPNKVYKFIVKFQDIWHFGLIIFGFHLLLLSKLVCNKENIPKVLAILLFLSGIGYIISNTANLFIADYETIRSKVEMIFILPMILSELGLAIWLIIKGKKYSFT